MSKNRLDWIEMVELKAFLCGLHEAHQNDEIDDVEVEDKFYEKFQVGYEESSDLINAIWEKLTVGKSPMTGKLYVGVSEPGSKFWIVKKEVE